MASLDAVEPPPYRRLATIDRLTVGKLTFAGIALVTGWNAFAPRPLRLPDLVPWDKAEHAIAFGLLALSGAVAFPSLSRLRLTALLGAAGAAIELIQALPFVHRDAELGDWVADVAAVVTTLILRGVLVRLAARRAHFTSRVGGKFQPIGTAGEGEIAARRTRRNRSQRPRLSLQSWFIDRSAVAADHPRRRTKPPS